MVRSVPTKPGWYRNPGDHRSFRYWDGRFWTGRSRPQPPWSTQAGAFEVSYEEADRSVEGPVHPHELREPVASGASSREWLAWRSRQAPGGWHRARSPQASGPSGLPLPEPPPRLSPSRRPVLALVCLLAVAVGVVMSSVAFIAPDETKSPVQERYVVAVTKFAARVNGECASSLPLYRGALAWGNDGPTIDAAAKRVELLTERIASTPAPSTEEGKLEEWLALMQEFSSDQARYATIIGAATRSSGGRLIVHELSAADRAQAAVVREQASEVAARADTVSAGLELGACRLEAVPAS